MHQAKLVFSIGFYLFAVTCIVASFQPLKLTPHPVLLKSLFLGQKKGYIIPGSEFNIFRPYLPKNSTYSVIFDEPFGQNKSIQHRLWNAQNYLCPIILNHDTIERMALVLCSSEAKANERLQEAGYTWIKIINPGVGIAKKNS